MSSEQLRSHLIFASAIKYPSDPITLPALERAAAYYERRCSRLTGLVGFDGENNARREVLQEIESRRELTNSEFVQCYGKARETASV